MAEIILIQPYTGAWDEMSIRAPEALLAVAALPAAKGYSIRIVDQRISKNYKKDIDSAVGPETKLFGITVITGDQIRIVLQLSSYLKRVYPRIPICLGGVHPTLLPEQTAAHPLVDYCVAGDGEDVFCELYERIRDRRPTDDLAGVFSKTASGEVRHPTASRATVADFDSLPALPYQLIPLEKYSVFYSREGEISATLNTSRGCLYRCKFCSVPVMNKGKWRGYSAARVLEKVRVLHERYGYGMIYFQDDYFPGTKDRFLSILKGLLEYNRKLRWSTLGIRADFLASMSDAEWDLLYASGCHSLEIGVESGSQRILNYVDKRETLGQLKEANRKLAAFGIKVKYSMVVGFPGESEDEILETVRFAKYLEAINPNAYCLIFAFLPIIGTPLYDEAVKKGFAAPVDLEGWAGMNFDGWIRKYSNWYSPELGRKIQAISFVSYFHNRNVAYKFSGSALLRFCYQLYHPIAAWRFRREIFAFPVEIFLKDLLLKIKYSLR